MLLRQIINPVYVARRSKLAVWEWRNPGRPWIAAEAVDILERYLAPHDVGLEYGSGRSTAWLAARVARLTSIEHDALWHAKVARMLEEQALKNVDLRLHPVEHPETELWHGRYDPMPAYVAAADLFPDGGLDFCLVDGAYREACITAIAPKLACGGLLILDNMNWRPMEHWAIPPAFRLISAGENVKTQTGVFVKTRRPANA
jgi:hypothetical protein